MTIREHVCTLSRRVPVRTHTHTPTHACVHPVIHPSVHSQQAKMKNGRFSTQNVTRVVKGSGDSDVKRKLINALRCPGVGAARVPPESSQAGGRDVATLPTPGGRVGSAAGPAARGRSVRARVGAVRRAALQTCEGKAGGGLRGWARGTGGSSV